eukprot:8373478-Pyramimonas_sp.AAC.1
MRLKLPWTKQLQHMHILIPQTGLRRKGPQGVHRVSTGCPQGVHRGSTGGEKAHHEVAVGVRVAHGE